MKPSILLIVSLIWLFFANSVIAQPIQSNYKNLTLNANWQDNKDKSKPVFLILHGTWATHSMELPATLQSLLSDQDYSSLAFTLSLNVDNRTDSPDCKAPITAGQNDNLGEISHWIEFIKQQGYKEIVVMAHSRGGAQMASFTSLMNDDAIQAQVLIAPMVSSHMDISAIAKKSIDMSDDQLLGPLSVLYCESVKVTASAYRSYYTAIPEKNTPTLIKNTSLNTLVFLGSEDKLTTNFKEQLPLIKNNKHISVTTVEGADHFFMDLYADEIIETVLESFE